MTNEEALAQLWRENSAEVAALLAEVFTARAASEGRSADRADLGEVAGALLAAAWELIKIADINADGQRGKRYAEFLRSHADAVEQSG